jgi:hypothetical protein
VFTSLLAMFRMQNGKNNPQKELFKFKFHIFEDLDIPRELRQKIGPGFRSRLI